MHRPIRKQLLAIEHCLKQHRCWQEVPPDPDLLGSTQPFAMDTLSLAQWLQFIFLPRMHALLDTGAQLPSRIAITPYAEEVLPQAEQSSRDLLQILKQFERSFHDE